MERCEIFGYFEGFDKYVFVSRSSKDMMCRESLPFLNTHKTFLREKIVYITDEEKVALCESLEEAFVFNDETEKWESNKCINFPNTKRNSFSVIKGRHSKELFIFGGGLTPSASTTEPNQSVTNEMFRLDLTKLEWELVKVGEESRVPGGRMGHLLFNDSISGNLIVYGGSTSEEDSGLITTDAVWEVSFTNKFRNDDFDDDESESEYESEGEEDEEESGPSFSTMDQTPKSYWKQASAQRSSNKNSVFIPGLLPQQFEDEEEGNNDVVVGGERGIAFCSGVYSCGRLVFAGGVKGDKKLWIRCYSGASTPFVRSFLEAEKKISLEYEFKDVEEKEDDKKDNGEEETEEEGEEGKEKMEEGEEKEEEEEKSKKKKKRVIEDRKMEYEGTISSTLSLLEEHGRAWEIETKDLYVDAATDEEIEFFLPAADHSHAIRKTVLLKFAKRLVNDCPIFKQKRKGKRAPSTSSESDDDDDEMEEMEDIDIENKEGSTPAARGGWLQKVFGGFWGNKDQKKGSVQKKKKKRKKKNKKRELTVGESLFHLLPPILFKLRRSFKSELDGEFGDVLKGFFSFCIMSPVDTSFEEFLYSDVIVDKNAEDYDESVNLIKAFLALDNPLRAYNVILRCTDATNLPRKYHTFIQLLAKKIMAMCKFDDVEYKDITKLRLLKRVLFVVRPFLAIGSPVVFSMKVMNMLMFSSLGKKLIILLLQIGRTEKEKKKVRKLILKSRKTKKEGKKGSKSKSEEDETERKMVELALSNFDEFLKDKTLSDCGMLHGIFKTEQRTIDIDRNEILPLKSDTEDGEEEEGEKEKEDDNGVENENESEEEEEEMGEYESLTMGANQAVEDISSEEESDDEEGVEEGEKAKNLREEEDNILTKIEEEEQVETEQVVVVEDEKKEEEEKKEKDEEGSESDGEDVTPVGLLSALELPKGEEYDMSVDVDEEKIIKEVNNNPLIRLVMSSAKKIEKVLDEFDIGNNKGEEEGGETEEEEKPVEKEEEKTTTKIMISDHFMQYFVEVINKREVEFTDFSIVQYHLFNKYFDLHNRFLEKKDFLKTINDTKAFETLRKIINSILPLLNGLYRNTDSMFVFKIFIKLLNKLVEMLKRDHDLRKKIEKLKDEEKRETLNEKRRELWKKKKQLINDEFEDGVFTLLQTLFRKDAKSDNLLVSLIAWLTGLKVMLTNSYIRMTEIYFRYEDMEKRKEVFLEQLKGVLLQTKKFGKFN